MFVMKVCMNWYNKIESCINTIYYKNYLLINLFIPNGLVICRFQRIFFWSYHTFLTFYFFLNVISFGIVLCIFTKIFSHYCHFFVQIKCKDFQFYKISSVCFALWNLKRCSYWPFLILFCFMNVTPKNNSVCH